MATKHPFEAMPESLWQASSTAAHYVLEHFTDDDESTRVITAIALGTAVEHLLMASVASIDVALLAERNHMPSMLAFSRHNKAGKLDLHKLKTIAWGTALALLELSDPKLAIRKDADFVMEIRNAGAHMAMTDKADLAEGAVRLARMVHDLHRFVSPLEEDAYWGTSLLPVAVKLRDERASAIQRSYLAKTAAARRSFNNLMTGVSAAQRESMLIAMESRHPRTFVFGTDGGTWRNHACPACNRRGYLHYILDRIEEYEPATEFDSEGEATGSDDHISVEMTPVIFECPVCNLALDSTEVDLLNGVGTLIERDYEVMDAAGLAHWIEDLKQGYPSIRTEE